LNHRIAQSFHGDQPIEARQFARQRVEFFARANLRLRYNSARENSSGAQA